MPNEEKRRGLQAEGWMTEQTPASASGTSLGIEEAAGGKAVGSASDVHARRQDGQRQPNEQFSRQDKLPGRLHVQRRLRDMQRRLRNMPWRKWLAGGLAASLIAGVLPVAGPLPEAAAAPAPNGGSLSPVIVTEIVPDHVGTDVYEFFELHNGSAAPQDVTDALYYRYTASSSPDLKFSLPANTVLAPGETKVFWNNTEKKAVASFNDFYRTELAESQVVSLPTQTGGFSAFANDGNRAVVVKSEGQDKAIAAYVKADISSSGTTLGVHYQASRTAEQGKYAVLAVPTPGSVEAGQLLAPPPAVVQGQPVVAHEPAASAKGGQALPIVVQVADGDGQPLPTAAATVYYRTVNQSVYKSVALRSTDGGTAYAGSIPAAAVAEESLLYYIQADNGGAKDTTPTAVVPIDLPELDPDRVPPLLVTEVTPDTANIGGSDGYEFIEIYNNTDRDLDFGDYKLYYRYPDKGPEADVVWASDPEQVTIPARSAIVLWIINGANGSATAAQFNANFGSSLVEGQSLFRVHSAGMANGSPRALVVGTNARVDLAVASYEGADVKTDKGIQYRYPTLGGKDMLNLGPAAARSTPGSVEAWQLPARPVHVAEDAAAPALLDRTGVAEADAAQDLDIRLEAEDESGIKSVQLQYRTDKSDWASFYLTRDYNDTYYHYLVPAADLIGKSYVEYKAVASDGQNRTELPAVRVPVKDGRDKSPLRLNVAEGQFIRGIHALKGTAEQHAPGELQLALDGRTVTEGVYASLEQDAYLAFDASGVDYYFKNAVTIGQEILYTFMDPIPSWRTLLYPIGQERLKAGDNGIWIRAGSKSGPFDDRTEENKDDFQIRNVRLILADGTVVYDPAFADRSKVIDMGDSAGKHVGLEFKFPLLAEQLRSRTYAWDTTTAADGGHEIGLTGPGGLSLARRVVVDNTAPAIAPTVEEGKTYRGAFTIDAAVTDALSGVKAGSVAATLDGKPAKLPYAATSSALGGGEHALVVAAEDNAGNRMERTVRFLVPDENPLAPELVAPLQGADVSGSSAELAVRVVDPTGDELSVGFYQGFKHSAERKESFRAFTGQAAVEPPPVLKPDGERELTAEEYARIASEDGDKLVNDSTDAFPYHRFEIKLDAAVKPQDEVRLAWKGSSLAGRKVTLYAWSASAAKWERLAQNVPADEQSFELSASVEAGDYAVDGVVHALVQDEIAAAPAAASADGQKGGAAAASSERGYDFSFVWMSDTQYYSESWPFIYEGNTKWVLDNRDAMDIKYVIHTGDIVDKSYKPEQWENAQRAMKPFDDAGMPYGVLAGNHDVGHQTGDYTEYGKNYGEDRFKDKPYYGGSYENNRGHYDLISAGGQDFIIVYMGWGIGKEQIQWIDDVLQQHPERKAILAFHEYLLVSGNRAPIADEIYEHVVTKNKNVFAVLSGHYHDAETKIDEIDDDGDGVPDRKVYQMLADYQGAEMGGLGYIRLMQFNLAANRVDIKTYSPYLDDYNYYDTDVHGSKDEFSLELNLAPMVKRVATDSMTASVYTQTPIGSVQKTASGDTARAAWTGLTDGLQEWYAVARDEHSGYARSDIWSFAAKGGATPTPTPSAEPTPTPSAEPTPTPDTGTGPGPIATPTPSPGPTASPSPSTAPSPSPSASPAPTASPAPQFSDVKPGHWAVGAISRAAALGIVTGDADGRFRPDAGVSRAELAAMLGRALGWTDSGNAGRFADAAKIPAYARGYAAQSAATGIIGGYADGTFGPQRTLTRAELAAVLARAAGLQAPAGAKPDFADAAQVPAWAKPYVAAVQDAGLMNGIGGGQFAPAQPVTRAQAAAALIGLIDLQANRG
ncbi:metallophosphoesterase [Paenibacillus albicereus]|uniref:Metallophosphoesterase n=1 Tax=Paenibacillus albicereus TaxID=2726185 RepID=A0A6H2GT08_9BACL|nr:S-layer homology domain-containing protein [Paenibacillus albicereus]QJC50489.1 metallophosphoesterase [Paenibacillus albicereus]